jgi:hypothetical protein
MPKDSTITRSARRARAALARAAAARAVQEAQALLEHSRQLLEIHQPPRTIADLFVPPAKPKVG